MPKDFEKFLSNPSNLSNPPKNLLIKDPNVHRNTAVVDEIKEKYLKFFLSETMGKVASMLFLAPLLTIQVSLQLSIIPHKEKYHDTILNEKRGLIKAPNEITLQDRRRYEMVVKSGVTEGNMPFRAPIYSSYREAFQALSNQGFLGFYKGNLAGSLHLIGSFIFKNYLITWFKFDKEEYFWKKSGNLTKLILALMVSSFTDLVVYPFQTVQSRFILQNRLPNFSVYKGFYHCFRKHYRRPWQFYQGCKAIIPYNFCLILGMTSFSAQNMLQGLWIGHNIGALLSYPLLTAMRRLQCQTELAGMIPLRYGSVTHCLKLMMNEEGIKGLYRGFAMHWIITNWTFSVGLLGPIYFSKNFYLLNID